MRTISLTTLFLLLTSLSRGSDGFCPDAINYTQFTNFTYQFDLTICEEGTIVTWDLDGGYLESSPGCSIYASFPDAGFYTINATFTDEDCGGDGASGVSIELYMSGPPPCLENDVFIVQLDANTFSLTVPAWVECNDNWQAPSWTIFSEFGNYVYSNTTDCQIIIDLQDPGYYTYTVTMYGMTYCDQGTFQYTTDGYCPDHIEVNELTSFPNGGYYCFYIPGLETGTEVIWDFGGGSADGLNEGCAQFFPGFYTVSASFWDPDCEGSQNQILYLNLYVEEPAYACDPQTATQNISVEQIDCDTYLFSSITYSDPNNSYTWDLNNDGAYGSEGEVGISVEHTFDQPGTYTIGLVVNQGFPWPSECNLIELVVEECPPGICADSILTTTLDWNTFNFFIDGIDEGQAVTWNFGDGYVVVDDESVDHEFEPGTYQVTATFMDADCPWNGPTILYTEVTIWTCTLDLNAEQISGGTFSFSATPSPEVTPLFWDFGDGTTTEDSWAVEHLFPEGSYVVCASYVSNLCPDTVETCVEIEWSCPDTISYSDECVFTALGMPEDALVDWTFTDGCYYTESNDAPVEWFLQFGMAKLCYPFVVCYSNDSLSEIGCSMVCDTLYEWNVAPGCWVDVESLSKPFFRVFPVPADTELHMIWDSGVSCEVTLWDATGRLVRSGLFTGSASWNVADLPPGLYLIRYRTETYQGSESVEIFR